MNYKTTIFKIGAILVFTICQLSLYAERQSEYLNRGIIATRLNASTVYISWRLLKSDPNGVTFNLYRNGIKLNTSAIKTTTGYTDATSSNLPYTVKAVINGVEQTASESSTPTSTYLYRSVPLSIPASGTTPAYTVTNTLNSVTAEESYPNGQQYVYRPNDCSIGDVDGDGEMEIIVKWDPTNSRDNSLYGYTGNVYLDAYKLNGTFLWRIDLGVNIRAGAHYTQFLVYDLDGDGKAEVACKTAPGTKDGTGNYLSKGPAASDNDATDYRTTSGLILTGPEYLTVFNGLTGAELATVDYVPARGTVSDWGDSYGNRSERYLACIAFLDGLKPSLVMCRGYYSGRTTSTGRMALSAWDYSSGTLTNKWNFNAQKSTGENSAYVGNGNHNLSVADVDGDGKDEILYGSCAIDHDGKGLYNTGLGHGDAMHVSDLIPSHPGLEVFAVKEESKDLTKATEIHDAATGANLVSVGVSVATDVGRGMAADIDPRYPGYEFWSGSTGGVISSYTGASITTSTPSTNFCVWWDGDLSRELLDGYTTTITKWNYSTSKSTTLLSASDSSNNTTKKTPCLQADLYGDWREEAIYRSPDNSALHIYSTTTATSYRFYSLLQDPAYREAIAWQNAAYNQPPHPGFYLGTDLEYKIRSTDSTVCYSKAPLLVDAGSTPYDTYQWSDGTTTKTISIDTTKAGVNKKTKFKIVSRIHGGEFADSLNVTFYKPVGTLAYASSQISTSGTSLSAYQWYVNDTLISGATASSYSPSRAGIYKVQLTGSMAGCTAFSKPFYVGRSSVRDTSACYSLGSITLDAGPGSDSYLWSTGATSRTLKVDTLMMIANVKRWFTVQYTVAGKVFKDSIGVIFKQVNPTISYASPYLSATCSLASSFQWYRNGKPIDGATSTTLKASANGHYTVLANTLCADTSVGYWVTDQKSAPLVSWSKPANIVFGQQLTSSQLNASADVSGTFEYTPALGTKMQAGINQVLTVAFYPTDDQNYVPISTTIMITVEKANPEIQWNQPKTISYGTVLSANELNATASTQGEFFYNPGNGTILNVGDNQLLEVSFVPTDNVNYNSVTASVNINVAKAIPVISWNNPADITYGQSLTLDQLNASSLVDGSFSYSPDFGIQLLAGTDQLLSVTFSPSDKTNYYETQVTVTINVNKADPILSWEKPSNIVYGDGLTSIQLNATADVSGSFSYTPAEAIQLKAGADQVLWASFVPNDGLNYNTTSVSTTISVDRATPSLTWSKPSNIVYGQQLTSLQLNAEANVSGAFTYVPAKLSVLNAGKEQLLAVSFVPDDMLNYDTITATTTITVEKATAEISWGYPASITYGELLSSEQLNATANTEGTFRYSPEAGSAVQTGDAQELLVNFSPSDTLNFAKTTATTYVKVNPAKLSISAKWMTITKGTDPSKLTFRTKIEGFVLNDDTTVISGLPAFDYGVLSAKSATGSYELKVSKGSLSAKNYEFSAFNSGIIKVIAPITQTGVCSLADNDILLYPNPVLNGELTIELPEVINGQLLVRSLNGMAIVSQKIASNKVVLDVRKFPAGVYMLQIVTSEFSKVKEFVKQ